MADEEKNVNEVNEEEVEETKEEVVEQLEEKTIDEIEDLREEGNPENEKVIDDAEKKVKGIFEDLRTWMKENSDPEKIKDQMNATKEDILDTLKTTRQKVLDVSNSDNFKKTVEAGKDLIEGSAGLIADGFKAGADILMSNENIAKVINKADKHLDTLRESEGLQSAVDAAEELTEKVNDALFGTLHRFFTKNDEDKSE